MIASVLEVCRNLEACHQEVERQTDFVKSPHRRLQIMESKA